MACVASMLLMATVAEDPFPADVLDDWKAGYEHFQGMEFEARRHRKKLPWEDPSRPAVTSEMDVLVANDAKSRRALIVSGRESVTPGRDEPKPRTRLVWSDRGYLAVQEQPDGIWSLTHVGRSDYRRRHGYFDLPAHAYALPTLPLADVVESGEFRFLGRSDRSGSGHVAFRFRPKPDATDPKVVKDATYTLVVDPDRRHALVEGVIEGRTGTVAIRRRWRLSYDGVDDGGWPLLEGIATSNEEDGVLHSEADWQVRYLGPSRRDAAEFTPEHYGLPSSLFDPLAGPSPRPWYGTWVVWLSVGLGCLAGGVLLWRRGEPTQGSSKGVTLIELLVVLAIVGVLAALALPAIQQARVAMRRSACAAKLGQIGLALHGYAETHGTLPIGALPDYDPRVVDPAGYPCNSLAADKGPLVGILPYLEQEALYQSFNADVVVAGVENATAVGTAVAAYVCPSDGPAGVRPLPPDPFNGYPVSTTDYSIGYGSYSACFGSLAGADLPAVLSPCPAEGLARTQADGTFVPMRGVGLAEIADGLSQTLWVSERSTAAALRWPGPTRNLDGRYWNWWVSAGLRFSLMHAMQPPNFGRFPNGGYQSPAAAASEHAGGVNALMGDGGVRFVADAVDSWPLDDDGRPAGSTRHGHVWHDLPQPGVWQALATRADGDAAGE